MVDYYYYIFKIQENVAWAIIYPLHETSWAPKKVQLPFLHGVDWIIHYFEDKINYKLNYYNNNT